MSKNNTFKYPKVTFGDTMKFLWKGMGKNRFLFFLTIISLGVASSASVIVPIYYKNFFDVITNVSGDRIATSHELIKLITIILAIYLCSWLFWRIGSLADAYFAANGMANLRRQAYKNIIYHSYTFFANNFTGSLVQKIGRYARAFERLTDRLVWDVVPLTIRLSVMLIVTYFINIKLSLIILSWALIYMVVGYFYSVWRLKYNIEMAATDSRTTAVLADTLTNQNNIEIFSRHLDEIENFEKVTDEQRKISAKNWSINMGLDAIQGLFAFIVEFFILYVAIIFWRDNFLTVGTFVLIQMYIIGLSGQLWSFARIIRDFYEGFADAKEMVEIMKLPYEIQDVAGAKNIVVDKGEIVFEDIHFSFNENREVLKGVNLKINAGQKVALVGPSGAGKTTFVRLILRFYDVISGAVKIDGQDIKGVTLESLRRNISIVPQDPLLFHRTIKENIRYGKLDATDAEIEEAAHLAHCDEFIENLPQKYETYVGERGIKLSGGERQRVAIARAILKNAPILILDEATSSLDSHSESLIQDALDNLMKGRTTVVIAHRLSTIKKMDRIIVLEKGNIKEDGSHEDLIAQEGGLYKALWNLQAGGFIQ
jgi:ATP-binding cassette subfamily B protein